MKEQAIDCKKMYRLARRLNIPRAHAVGLMEMFWKGVRKDAPSGSLRDVDPIDIAVWCDWSGSADELLLALVSERWVDAHQEHKYVVHDWPEHCENSVHRQLVKERRWFADGSAPNIAKAGLHSADRLKAEEFYACAKPPRFAMAEGGIAKIRQSNDVATPSETEDSPPKNQTPYRTEPNHTSPHHTADMSSIEQTVEEQRVTDEGQARRRGVLKSGMPVSAATLLASADDAQWLRELLWRHSRLPTAPDMDITRALLETASRGRDWWRSLIERLERAKQRPKQTYGWYVGIVEREIRGEAA